MSKLINMIDKKFGRLLVIERSENKRFNSGATSIYWLCKCDCGNSIVVKSQHLRDGKIRSCGCLQREEQSQRIREYNTGKFGSSHPRWNKNKSDEDRIIGRSYIDYSIWRKSVYERDQYACVICQNDPGEDYLIAHHLDSYHWDVGGRIDIDNGVTLCKECHKEFHKLYGTRNNTESQFMEFLFERNPSLFDGEFPTFSIDFGRAQVISVMDSK